MSGMFGVEEMDRDFSPQDWTALEGQTDSVSERIASLSRQSVVLGFSECDVLERL
jgi:hypothetical protein